MKINKKYSKESLSEFISGIEITNETVNHSLEVDFIDVVVKINFSIQGYFDVQEQTYEDPPFSDLKNIWIEIYEISIHEENKITFLSSLEINNIEKQIKKLI